MAQSVPNTNAMILNANNYRPLRECISGGGVGGGELEAPSAVRLLRCIADAIPSFKRTSPRLYRLRRMRGLRTAAAPALAWPVIVRSVAPRGGESRHGTKRSVVTRYPSPLLLHNPWFPPRALPYSLCSRAVRWRVNIHRLRHNSRNAPPNGLLLSVARRDRGMKL